MHAHIMNMVFEQSTGMPNATFLPNTRERAHPSFRDRWRVYHYLPKHTDIVHKPERTRRAQDYHQTGVLWCVCICSWQVEGDVASARVGGLLRSFSCYGGCV